MPLLFFKSATGRFRQLKPGSNSSPSPRMASTQGSYDTPCISTILFHTTLTPSLYWPWPRKIQAHNPQLDKVMRGLEAPPRRNGAAHRILARDRRITVTWAYPSLIAGGRRSAIIRCQRKMHGGSPEGAMAEHQCVDIAHVSWGCACVAWVAPAACELASLTQAIALQGQVTTGVRSLDRHHVRSEEHRHLGSPDHHHLSGTTGASTREIARCSLLGIIPCVRRSMLGLPNRLCLRSLEYHRLGQWSILSMPGILVAHRLQSLNHRDIAGRHRSI